MWAKFSFNAATEPPGDEGISGTFPKFQENQFRQLYIEHSILFKVAWGRSPHKKVRFSFLMQSSPTQLPTIFVLGRYQNFKKINIFNSTLSTPSF